MTDTTPTVPEWQPISTAPRDGVRVLAYLPFFWGNGERGEALDVVAFDKRAGWFFPTPRNYVQLCEVKPTHWMPLPAPPELAREQQP